jgi:hypothetical protein
MPLQTSKEPQPLLGPRRAGREPALVGPNPKSKLTSATLLRGGGVGQLHHGAGVAQRLPNRLCDSGRTLHRLRLGSLRFSLHFLERNYGIKALIGMNWIHISDHDLEKYYLGMVTAEEELAPLEEHILACSSCAGRAEATQAYVDTLRVALLTSSD